MITLQDSRQFTRTSRRHPVFGRLSAASMAAPDAYLACAREALSEMLATPDLLDRIDLHRLEGEYTRNTIHADERITILAIVWAPGAETAIHDHHCSCCFGMYTGVLDEEWFHAIDDRQAGLFRTVTRREGDIATMLPTSHNLHRMANRSAREAVSIHVYGYDSSACATSIAREYRLRE